MQTFELIPWIEDHRGGDASRFGTYRVAKSNKKADGESQSETDSIIVYKF